LLLQVKSRQLKKLFEKYQVRDMSNALSMEHDSVSHEVLASWQERPQQLPPPGST
jgi:hypothetical protein